MAESGVTGGADGAVDADTRVAAVERWASNPNIDHMLPSDLLHEDEVVVFAIKPSLWTILFLSFRTVVIAGSGAILAMLLGPKLHLGLLAGYVIEGCALVVVLRLGFAVLQWVSRVYVLTNRRVMRMRGVFTIDIFQCSLTHVQNTFLTMTLVQRLFGLGSIAFTTAGTGGIEAIWRHVSNPLGVHRKLIRAINAASNQESSGL